jgi:hypothetical protein
MRQPLNKGLHLRLRLGIAFRPTYQDTDPRHRRLLRLRSERPRSRNAADKRDEIAPLHGFPFNEPGDTVAHPGPRTALRITANRPIGRFGPELDVARRP